MIDEQLILVRIHAILRENNLALTCVGNELRLVQRTDKRDVKILATIDRSLDGSSNEINYTTPVLLTLNND